MEADAPGGLPEENPLRRVCARLHGGAVEADAAGGHRAHELRQEALRVRPAVPAAAHPRLRPPAQHGRVGVVEDRDLGAHARRGCVRVAGCRGVAGCGVVARAGGAAGSGRHGILAWAAAQFS